MPNDIHKFDKIFEDLFRQDFIVTTKDSEYNFDLIHELKSKNFIYQSQSAVYKLTDKGYEVKEKGSYKAYIEFINKENDKELYIRQLEIDKSKLEIDKLKHEESVRELDGEIKELTRTNLKLQNFQIISGLIGAFVGFVATVLFEHWFGLIQILLRYLLK